MMAPGPICRDRSMKMKGVNAAILPGEISLPTDSCFINDKYICICQRIG